MIRRLSVKGYKTFHEVGPVALAPLSGVVGANATGKSNLVDLLGLLASLVRVDRLEDAFSDHRGYPHEAFHHPEGFGEEGIRALKAKRDLSFRIEVDLDLSDRIVGALNRELEERERLEEKKATYTRVSCKRLRYEVELRMPHLATPLVVEDESLVAVKEDGTVDRSRKPFLRRDDSAGRFVLRLERQGHPRYFEPLRHRTILSEVGDPVYHPHVVAAKKEISSWRTYYVEPARIREAVGLVGALDPGRHGENLAPFYYHLQQDNPRQFRNLEINLSQLVPSIRGLVASEGHQGLLELWVKEASGGEFPLRLVSEGTLRLLSILAISAAPEPPAVVVYEEPESGVHPRRLEEVLDVFRNLVRQREVQVVFTTHSASLCDLMDDAGGEEALLRCLRNEDGSSSLEPVSGGPLVRKVQVDEALRPQAAGPSAGERLLSGEHG